MKATNAKAVTKIVKGTAMKAKVKAKVTKAVIKRVNDKATKAKVTKAELTRIKAEAIEQAKLVALKARQEHWRTCPLKECPKGHYRHSYSQYQLPEWHYRHDLYA